MGLDIGFSLYEKKPFDERGELVNAENIDTPFVCGWTDTTEVWGTYFIFNMEETITPIFQTELQDKVIHNDSYDGKFKFMEFKEFKDTVMQVLNDAFEKARKEKLSYLKSINGYEKDIKELRELQRNCNEDQSYAFDRWEQNIRDYKECIDNITNNYKTFDEEDYNYTHALSVKELLKKMENYLEEDKYYVVPYYSY